ncbi:hypothetical protein VE03_04270 [Pseudogymnoascus sp. 23342-1-I1]|nr:hypothetical protein VE03_04270 [Pseudogymnoascus sp. 23342-1-I1]
MPMLLRTMHENPNIDFGRNQQCWGGEYGRAGDIASTGPQAAVTATLSSMSRSIYGSSTGTAGGDTGGSLATALALTEALTERGVGRYPSALITTDAIFDFSPLAIASLHPSAAGITSLTGPPLKTRTLFPNPPSTLDPLASPLLLFRGSAFHSSAFPGSWEPHPSPPPPALSAPDWEGWTDSPSELDLPTAAETIRDEPGPDADDRGVPDFDPTYPQKRSYLKFPPAHWGLRLPACNFQVSHPLPPPPSKASKSKSAPPPPAHADAPLEATQAQLMASAINRSVRMGYDTPLSRRGNEEEGEDERAVVSELGGEGNTEERGAVGAREWLRDTMDWR